MGGGEPPAVTKTAGLLRTMPPLLSGVGFLLAGWLIPVLFPSVNPIVAWALSGVAVVLILAGSIIGLHHSRRSQTPQSPSIAADTFIQNHTGSGSNIGKIGGR